jgi:biotin carboxyl carrier protein
MAERRYSTTIDGETHAVRVEPGASGTYSVQIGDDPPVEVRVLADGPPLTLLVGERVLELAPSGDGFAARGGVLVGVDSQRGAGRAHASSENSGKVQAPMPGRIVKLLVAPGDEVAAGAGLVVMEAMKMENEILAPHAGTVARLLVATGDTVERDATLVELEAP